LIGALQMAAKDNPLGLQYLMADHLVDPQAIEGLLAHFNTTLGNDEVGAMAQLGHSCCDGHCHCQNSWNASSLL